MLLVNVQMVSNIKFTVYIFTITLIEISTNSRTCPVKCFMRLIFLEYLSNFHFFEHSAVLPDFSQVLSLILQNMFDIRFH